MSDLIFICYRRDDSQYAAYLLRDRLRVAFPGNAIFLDVENIKPGEIFPDKLQQALSNCRVLLPIIGPLWLDAQDARGARRLDDPNDYVRLEIATALSQGIRVIPILLANTPMPRGDNLPDDLQKLASSQYLEVRTTSLNDDVARLIKSIKSDNDSSSDGSLQLAIEVGPIEQSRIVHTIPGNGRNQWFRDVSISPEMVVVPPGAFWMGAPREEKGSRECERPQLWVTISKPFMVGRFAVTVDEFQAFCMSSGYVPERGASYSSGGQRTFDKERYYYAPGFKQDLNHPVVCVNWHDARAYVQWLSERTGRAYRLLTSAEWEYACRAGTTTAYWWGPAISRKKAHWGDDGILGLPSFTPGTMPVDSFEPNPWGLYQMHGNVEEWCEDNVHETYSVWPTDGSAWKGGTAWNEDTDALRVKRGGAWNHNEYALRSASRSGDFASVRDFENGFRIARSL
jgi:formylglycine-generating enzyme required for sulfatase activity